MSFSNPGVFAAAKELKAGDAFTVAYTPGDQYYNWAKLEKTTSTATNVVSSDTKNTPVKVATSQYETREERQLRQLHIVRQSSLAQAVASLTPGSKTPLLKQEVIDLAQYYVDWVYANGEDGSLTLSADNQGLAI